MDIEEEIARALHAGIVKAACEDRIIIEVFGETPGFDFELDLAQSLSPLLNRVRAEARAEAFREAREAINHTRNVPSLITLADKFGGYHQGQRSGLEMADGLIARIEQNSEGNET